MEDVGEVWGGALLCGGEEWGVAGILCSRLECEEGDEGLLWLPELLWEEGGKYDGLLCSPLECEEWDEEEWDEDPPPPPRAATSRGTAMRSMEAEMRASPIRRAGADPMFVSMKLDRA
jgi:hypothetical protein